MSTSLNPQTPEYKLIPPRNQLSLLCFKFLSPLEIAAICHIPPSPSVRYFHRPTFGYLASPPPPFCYFPGLNRNAVNVALQSLAHPPFLGAHVPEQWGRRDFGQIRAARASGSPFGSGSGSDNMNERRITNNVSNNNGHNNNNKKKKKEKNKYVVVPIKRHEGKTTVVIKNIPYSCPREELMKMLDKFCMIENSKIRFDGHVEAAAYDFLYLPIDFKTGNGKGYAFVNVTNAPTVWRFFKAFHLGYGQWDFTKWNEWPKKLEIVSAKIQGKEAMVRHFKESKFKCEKEEFLPVWMDPPRDGPGQPVKLTAVGIRQTRRNNHQTLRA